VKYNILRNYYREGSERGQYVMVEIIRVKTENEMEQVFEIRREVFIREQGIPEEIEMDELDSEAVHVLATVNGVPAGCGRLLQRDGYARIGRVAVKKEMRRNGIGEGICKLLMAIAGDNGAEKVIIGAQLTAVEFYKSLGFEKEGDVFMEAGIEHVKMVRPL
jgi:predicted GNAT family N-acyltransferase